MEIQTRPRPVRLTRGLPSVTLSNTMKKPSEAPQQRQWPGESIPMDDTPLRFDRILARAKVMKQVLQRLQLAAASDVPVLILGETGTGKDLVAQSIHLRSRRRKGPFVALNAGAIPRDLVASELFGHEQGAFTGALRSQAGKLALARGGTLFLDEINALDLQAQATLLRVLENREYYPVGSQRLQSVDLRVIAASNADLSAAVKNGSFREDLYYRLEVFTLKLPPLRERKGAVAMLAQEFLREVNQSYELKVHSIATPAMRRLEAYAWPGNVRELKNVIQRGVLLARQGELGEEHLPERFTKAAEPMPGALRLDFSAGRSLAHLERAYIRLTLDMCQGNKSRAASLLGISRKNLYEKLARYRT
jgi:transcriptional regulator with PAS, ATPase and Fis domain